MKNTVTAIEQLRRIVTPVVVAAAVLGGATLSNEAAAGPSSSECRNLGGLVGGALGAAAGGKDHRWAGAGLGAALGAVTGRLMCDDEPQAQQNGRYESSRSSSRQAQPLRPMTMEERQRLDAEVDAVQNAHNAFLNSADRVNEIDYQIMMNPSLAGNPTAARTRDEAQRSATLAREGFVRSRDDFSRLATELQRRFSVDTRDYQQVAASFQSVDVRATSSYRTLRSQAETYRHERPGMVPVSTNTYRSNSF